MPQSDFLIIGSGVAGLTYAIKVATQFPQKNILILTKTYSEETNTTYAQGGIAGVTNFLEDSFDKHIEDTLIAGDGLCNVQSVEIVVKEGVDRIKELINWGADFDKDASGEYKLGKEGGHSEFRILHHKDITGKEIERALLAKARQFSNIEINEEYFAIDLITQHHLGHLITKSTPDIECYGVYALGHNTSKVEKFLAPFTMLATGGCGQAYRSTTNPSIATGDGVAMAYRAKGRVENMEFIQFHPTALYEPGVRGQSFLITEAVRGDGGILRNHKGEAFMEHYDERKDLAPRDIVARAIDNEMKVAGTEYVYLDCRHFDKEKFIGHFPNIYDKCKSIGIDITKDMIPVAPAAHYSCGGIKTDQWACTSIKNLLAAGECASTGLHGANRLASNSLLEGLVYAHRAYLYVTEISSSTSAVFDDSFAQLIPDWKAEGTIAPKEMILITQSIKELKLLMSDYVGIVRNNERLNRAMRRLDLLYEETEALYQKTILSPQLCELRNTITVGFLIVKSAMFRHESRGLHYNTDYPGQSSLVQNIVL